MFYVYVYLSINYLGMWKYPVVCWSRKSHAVGAGPTYVFIIDVLFHAKYISVSGISFRSALMSMKKKKSIYLYLNGCQSLVFKLIVVLGYF